MNKCGRSGKDTSAEKKMERKEGKRSCFRRNLVSPRSGPGRRKRDVFCMCPQMRAKETRR